MSKPEWIERAQAKALPEEFVERLEASKTVSEEEKLKIVDAVRVAADIADPRIPPSEGLVELPPNEKPVAGMHFVIWGHGSLSMTEPYPVLKVAHTTERNYVTRMGDEARYLVEQGLKNPLHREQGRADRAEQYARWRYRGYVAGEVASL